MFDEVFRSVTVQVAGVLVAGILVQAGISYRNRKAEGTKRRNEFGQLRALYEGLAEKIRNQDVVLLHQDKCIDGLRNELARGREEHDAGLRRIGEAIERQAMELARMEGAQTERHRQELLRRARPELEV